MLEKIFPFLSKNDALKNESADKSKSTKKDKKDCFDIEYQTFVIINEKIYLNKDELENVEFICVTPKYIDLFYEQNPEELLYQLQEMSKDVSRIEVRLLTYMDKNTKYGIEIRIYPKHANQKISIPYYLEERGSEGFMDISLEFYDKLSKYLDKESEGMDLSYIQTFTIRNQELYYDILPTFYENSDIEPIYIEPKNIESLYSQKPDELLYHLKQLSNSVSKIIVQRFESHENGHNCYMEIRLYLKEPNQQLALPSYFKSDEDSFHFGINYDFYTNFFEFLETKSASYVELTDTKYSLSNHMNKIVSLSNNPNSVLYVIWDLLEDKNQLTLVELGKPIVKKTVSVTDTKVYLVSPMEIHKRFSLN